MDTALENAPHNCPGTESEDAGKSDPCKGCPNQQICSSGVTKKELDMTKILANFNQVKRIILVMSGKGGVGKSTVASNLARIIASDENIQVGIMDIDLCGPSIPQMMNVADEKVHQSGSGWSPIYADENLAVMSIAFLLDSLDDAVIWRGPKKNALIRQFLEDVDWGSLDYLIIDTPPGTSDEHLSIFTYLKKLNVSGAIIVTTPQEVALLDVRKQINFCRKTNIKVLGVVENMSTFTCPNCHKDSIIFPPSSGGVEVMCSEMDTKRLVTIPLDPLIGKACDLGESYFTKFPESPTTLSYMMLYKSLKSCIS